MHEAAQCLITLARFGFLIQIRLFDTLTILKGRRVITVLFSFGVGTPVYMQNQEGTQSREKKKTAFTARLTQSREESFAFFTV